MRVLSQWFARHCIAAAIGCTFLGFDGASAQTNVPPAIITVCAPCHGIDGTGGDVEKPNLAGQKQYLPPPAAHGLSSRQA